MSLVRTTESTLVIDNRRQRVLAMSLVSVGLLVLAVFLTVVGTVSIVAWSMTAVFGAFAIRDALFTTPVVVDVERRTLRGPVFAFFAQIGAVVLYRRGEGREAGAWALGVAMPGAAAMASMSRQLATLDQAATPYRESGEEPPALELRGDQVEVHDVMVHAHLPGLRDAADRLAAALGVSLVDLTGEPQCLHPDLSKRTFSFDVAALRKDVMGVRKELAEKA